MWFSKIKSAMFPSPEDKQEPGQEFSVSLEGQLQSCQEECLRLEQKISPIREALQIMERGPAWEQEVKECMDVKAKLQAEHGRLVKDYEDCDARLRSLLSTATFAKKEKASSSSLTKAEIKLS